MSNLQVAMVQAVIHKTMELIRKQERCSQEGKDYSYLELVAVIVDALTSLLE